MDPGLNDTDGDAIVNGVPYKVRVLSTGDGVNATVDVLSGVSNELTLNAGASPATNVVMVDIGDKGNGEDVQVTFDKAADESTVDEYRVIVVKSAKAGNFTLADADKVPFGIYRSVPKTGSNLVKFLNSNTKDTDGDLITFGVPYKTFIWSIADGVNVNNNSLSIASNEITLGVLGLGDINQIDFVHVYSFGSKIYIQFENGFRFQGEAVVYDITGRAINSVPLNQQHISLEVPGNTSGVYILKLFLEDRVLAKKIFLY